ncbi:ATP-dependent Clp protease ATP-binding subunit [Leifsonia poae]|uniref:ATPase AAA n=1 Tax=Leifsonia poae TaxID=110933 RepID=A0A9W6H688_9MICO|nr:ATP-dependent Clp protease ATP-binding subunit [Leifsonia poae]GLJ74721.1 ATPase AAA [Leifsonia poae]
MPENFTPEGSESSEGNSFDEFLARYLAGERARAARSIDISRFLSRRTQEILGEAGRFALEHGHRELDALHILRVMVSQEPAADAMRRIGVDPAKVAIAAEQRLPQAGDVVDADAASITPSAQRALFHAYQVARASGSTYIDPEHLFFALVIVQDTPAGQVLQNAGVTADALTSAMREPATVGSDGSPVDAENDASETPMLDQFGTDLTELARDGRLDPVIGRLDEIEQTIEILSRRTKNNPVLVGEAGVGKTAIVEGLAQAVVDGGVPEQLLGKRVVSLDLPAMLAGTRYRGDFEERLTNLMDEIGAHRDELIVFIDELHTVVGAGGAGEGGGMDAGNILKPRLARGELHLVGATTLKEYRRIEKDPALERRFQPVTVGEPSIEDAVLILSGLRGAYEEHHGVQYTDDAIRSAVELSARYVSDRFLPDKAIDLIDQAGARLRLSLGKRVDASALMERLADLEASKNAAVGAEHYEEASRLRDEIESVQSELESLTAKPRLDAVIGEPEIAAVISRATGIPVSRIGEADRERLARLESELHERVIGQDDAVVAVAKAVRRNRTGLGDESRPVGSFLFLGPTGVGKTELAKSLASSLFGDDKAMLRFDMSEFGERHTVARLVGAPPGYVGYDEAGQLTERVRRNPYSVVLFDEIEKAHPDVFNLLLQVLDDGRLTDGQGRTVDFRNTVIIMTSNLGSEFLASRSGALGFVPVGASGDASGFASEKDLRDRVMGKLREAMRPEFLNRIDEIVLFRKLDASQLRGIVRLLLTATANRLQQRDIDLDITDAAVEWIAETGYEPEYGARPLRRVIQREIDDRIADLLVTGELTDGGTVHLDARDGILQVTGGALAELPFAA